MSIFSKKLNRERKTALSRLQDVRAELVEEEKKLANAISRKDELLRVSDNIANTTDRTIREHKDTIKELLDKKNVLETEIDAYSIDINCLREELERLDADMQMTVDAKGKLENDVQSLQKNIAHMSEEEMARNATLNELQGGIDSVRDTISTLEQSKNVLRTDIEILKTEKEQLELNIAEKKKEENRLQSWESSLSKRETLVREQYNALGIRNISTYGN